MKQVIDYYVDPSAIVGGQSGCFIARLAKIHGIWGVGVTQDIAIRDVLRTAESHGYSGDIADYIVRRNVQAENKAKERNKFERGLVFYRDLRSKMVTLDA